MQSPSKIVKVEVLHVFEELLQIVEVLESIRDVSHREAPCYYEVLWSNNRYHRKAEID